MTRHQRGAAALLLSAAVWALAPGCICEQARRSLVEGGDEAQPAQERAAEPSKGAKRSKPKKGKRGASKGAKHEAKASEADEAEADEAGGDDASKAWRALESGEASAAWLTREYKAYWGLEAIRAAEAYTLLEHNGLPVGGEGVVVAVTDAGVDFAHPELRGRKAKRGHNTDAFGPDAADYNDGHGTHCAGTVAAERDGKGMHGVAFRARVVACSEEAPGDLVDAAKAGARVVSMSWSAGSGSDDDFEEAGEEVEALREALLGATALDVVWVTSLGNSEERRHGYPVAWAEDDAVAGRLLAVGAVDERGGLASLGCDVSPEGLRDRCLMAPGTGVLSAAAEGSDEGERVRLDGRDYFVFDGTSMAVPHVAGAAAVLRAAFPDAKAAEIVDALLMSATPMHAEGEDTDAPSAVFGRGLLNLEAAVQWMGARRGR